MTPARALALSLALALVLGCGRYGPPSPMAPDSLAPSPLPPDSVDAVNEAAPAAGAENGNAAR